MFAHFAGEKVSILFNCFTMIQYVRCVVDGGGNIFRNMRFPVHIVRGRVYSRIEDWSAPYVVEPVLSPFMSQLDPARNAMQKACIRANICPAGHAGGKGRYPFDNERISAVTDKLNSLCL